MNNIGSYWLVTLMRARGLRKLSGKGWQAMSSCKCVRVKHSFPPSPFLTAFVYLKRMCEWCSGDQLISEAFEWKRGISHGLSSLLTGFKSACQMGGSQHLCSQMDASMFTKASSSEIQTKTLTLDFEINCKADSLIYSALRMIRKGFYSSPNLPELIFIENFRLVWLCN